MNSMKRFSTKALAVFLSVLMVLTTFPLTVLAQAQTGEAVFTQVETESRILEITSERTSRTKTFRLPDGSYTVAQYETDVHYLDASGNWQDIDNSLSVADSEVTTSNARVKFAKQITGNGQLFTLHDGNQKLTFSLDGAAKKVEAEITNHNTQFGEDTPVLQKITTLDHVSALVKYAEILPSVDLEYVINGLDIKENIIVKEKTESYSYSFTMALNNLSARQEENGAIILSNSDGVAVYYIPAPVMWDATNTRSHAVSLTLVDLGNGKYTLTITADSAWMNAEERVFPITIDPPLCTQPSSNVLDISFNAEGEDPDDSGVLYASDLWTAYWKLTALPTLPRGAYITNATFGATAAYAESDGYRIGVYQVLTAWDADTEGTLDTNYIDYNAINMEETADYTWNVTPIVQRWYKGYNYGLALMPIGYDGMSDPVEFYSSDASTQAVRPRLCITYRDMKGMEDYWSFSSQSAGFAGTGSVNHANGNLVLTIPTLTTTDALMPITPTLVYDTAMANKTYVYGNAQIPDSTSHSPVGMRFNLHETLLKYTYITHIENSSGIGITQGSETYIVWSDSDGTEHYFKRVSTDAGTGVVTYTDEDGMLLTITENADGSCTLTDSNKNKRQFHSYATVPSGAEKAWMLASIEDKSGNEVFFGISTAGKITSVNLTPNGLSAVNQLKIEYNANGMPLSVWNPTAGEAVVFAYSSTATGAIVASGGTYLRQVKRVHGTKGTSSWSSFSAGMTVDATASYTYDASGRLTSVTNDLTDYTLQYTYNTVGKVSAVQEMGSGATEGQEFSLTYSSSSTVIRTSGTDDSLGTTDDLLTTYLFDDSGRTVGCYTTDLGRTQIYGASYGEYVDEEENEKAKNNLKSSVQSVQHSSNYLLGGGFEKATNSTLPYWTVQSGTVGIETTLIKNGAKAATLSVSSSVPTTTIKQSTALEKGTYTLSLYVQSMETADVQVTISATSSSRNYTVTEQVPVNEYYASGEYVFASLEIEAAPTTTGGKEIFTVSISVTGDVDETVTLNVDDVMLAKSLGAAEYDMTSMGHFETGGTYAPANVWSFLNYATGRVNVVDSGITAFGDVLKIENGTTYSAYAQQIIYEASDNDRSRCEAGEIVAGMVEPLMFTASAWGKTEEEFYKEDIWFGLQFAVEYYNGITGQTFTKTYDVKFSSELTDWQFLSQCVATEVGYGMVNKIYLRVVANNYPWAVYVDGISVIENSNMTEIYEYNENGLVSYCRTGNNSVMYSYDNSQNLILSVYPRNKKLVRYTYDTSNRLEKETHISYSGAWNTETGRYATETEEYTVSYSYITALGLVNAVTTTDCEANTQTKSTSVYETDEESHIFGVLLTETDALGRTTRYFYDNSNGRLLATTYPAGNGVCYTYDAIGNLTQALPANVNTSNTSYVADTSSASVGYTYDDVNRLEKIQTESTSYTFTYDEFGNTTQIQAGSNTLASYEYNANNGKLSMLTYGNGLEVHYFYDELDRISELWYNTGVNGALEKVYSYTYSSAGALYSVTDHKNNEATFYKYDTEGKLVQSFTSDTATATVLSGTEVWYDEQARVEAIFHSLDYTTPTGKYFESVSYGYTYDDITGELTKMAIFGEVITGGLSGAISPTYDNLGRTTQKVINFTKGSTNAFYNKYTYTYQQSSGGLQSAQIASVTSQVKRSESGSTVSSSTYNYTYDANGNITQITDASGSLLYRYTYDDLGQLIREDNALLASTFVYTYDDAGNILAKAEYTLTLTNALGSFKSSSDYTYSDDTWGDRLSFSYYSDGYGENIEYDAIGNPTLIGYYVDDEYDFHASTYLDWNGRELVSYESYDYSTRTNLIEYTYNADGIRTSKTVNGIKHEYILNGSQILAETWTQGGTEYLLVYLYDDAGYPVALKYRTSNYAEGVFDHFFFEKNIQGDIVAIYNATGEKIGTYVYNAWGELTATTVSGNTTLENNIVNNLNPFRYRGYYYDVETGWYYLQSRYYNPAWGRFISADGLIGSGGFLGYNLFAYCANNPVVYVDSCGNYPVHFMKRFFSVLMANKFFDLFQGWQYIIHNGQSTTNPQKHIHVFNLQKGLKYTQNEDGSNHHGDKEGDPPKRVRDALEKKGIWKWKFDSHQIETVTHTVVLSIMFFRMAVLYSKSFHPRTTPEESLVAIDPRDLMQPEIGVYFLPLPYFGILPALEPAVELLPALS